MDDLDAFDRRLLKLVQQDAGRTAEQLGAEVGLSASAVQKRLKRLRDIGAIEREVAIIGGELTSGTVMSLVHVTLARDVRDGGAAFERRIKAAAEVTQCYHVTGDFDYVVLVHTHAMRGFTDFIERDIKGQADIARYETHVVLKPVKRGLEAPL